MKSTRTPLAVVAGALSCALLLSACGGGNTGSTGSAESGSPVRGGDLVMARSQDPQSFDTRQIGDNWSIWTLESMLDTLLVPSADGKGVESSLATKWEVGDDKTTWTFHLRDDVTFSDGTPLTAEDVKFSLDYDRSPEGSFGFLDSAIDSVSAPDARTVVVKTTAPWAPLLADLAGFNNSIFPANFGGKSASEFWERPIGSGPFKLDSWDKGTTVKLVRNDRYWKKGLPYLDSVTFKNVADDNTRANMLRGGQAQIDEFPAYSSITTLDATPGLEVDEFPSSNTEYLVMNNKRPELADVHVRRAISYAIDRASMVKAVLFGHGQVANSFLSPSMLDYAEVKAPQYDMAAAKAELAQSKYPHGFSTTIMVTAGKSAYATAAQIIQKSLQQLGIEVKIKTVDGATAGQMQGQGNYDLMLTYFTTDIADPQEWVSFSAMSPTKGIGNAMSTFYDNPTVDDLAQQAEQTFDEAQRKQLYTKIQQIIAQDQPHTTLYYTPFVYARSEKVHGFTAYPTGNYTLATTWMGK